MQAAVDAFELPRRRVARIERGRRLGIHHEADDAAVHQSPVAHRPGGAAIPAGVKVAEGEAHGVGGAGVDGARGSRNGCDGLHREIKILDSQSRGSPAGAAVAAVPNLGAPGSIEVLRRGGIDRQAGECHREALHPGTTSVRALEKALVGGGEHGARLRRDCQGRDLPRQFGLRPADPGVGAAEDGAVPAGIQQTWHGRGDGQRENAEGRGLVENLPAGAGVGAAKGAGQGVGTVRSLTERAGRVDR